MDILKKWKSYYCISYATESQASHDFAYWFQNTIKDKKKYVFLNKYFILKTKMNKFIFIENRSEVANVGT